VRRNVSSPARAMLGPRSCSGDGGGNGRMDPLRGGGDSTVICCGERSGAAAGGGADGGGGGGIESSDNTGKPSGVCSEWVGSSAAHGVLMIGVSPVR
jgi:hypothetical protein